MCSPSARCAQLEFDDLARLTARLVADPRWSGLPMPVVARGCPRGYDGKLVGRRITYADVAPVCVVPHELAHLASGERAHGPRWAAWYVRLASWV